MEMSIRRRKSKLKNLKNTKNFGKLVFYFFHNRFITDIEVYIETLGKDFGTNELL